MTVYRPLAPMSTAFGGRYSIQLSYERMVPARRQQPRARVAGAQYSGGCRRARLRLPAGVADGVTGRDDDIHACDLVHAAIELTLAAALDRTVAPVSS